MAYLILIMIGLSIFDIREMKMKNMKKEILVYLAFMLLTAAFGIFYFTNPERISFVEIILSLIGRGV